MTLTLDILERLVSFDTVSARSNLGLISYVEDFLKIRGFTVHRLPDPSGEKAGLFAEIAPGDGGILLSGHTDVVPVEGQVWTCDPFRLVQGEDRLYGRGTTDMKGFVASALALADRAAQLKLHEPLKIVLSYDEEIGCVGLQQMLGRLAPMLGRPRLCVVGEPTQMRVAVGHKGKAALRAICRGEAGHSAMAPQFTNALHLAAEFIAEMRILQTDLEQNGARDNAYDVPYSTVHVGKLSGGTALNIVPNHAELELEYRFLPADSAPDILQRIERAAADIAARYRAGGGLTVEQYNEYPGLDVAAEAPVIGDALRLVEGSNTVKIAFGTEAGFFDGLGIPTVVCGPGSMAGQGHKPDEYIDMSELAACDAMMERILEGLRA